MQTVSWCFREAESSATVCCHCVACASANKITHQKQTLLNASLSRPNNESSSV